MIKFLAFKSSTNLHRCFVRCFASNSSELLISLKSPLKRLYLKVHPDLFEFHPEEKKVNNNSFAILNQFMQELEEGILKRSHYPLRFYIKHPEEDKTGMKLIEFTMAPHTPSSAHSAALSSSSDVLIPVNSLVERRVYAALEKLFNLIEIPHDLNLDKNNGEEVAQFLDDISLDEFLRQNRLLAIGAMSNKAKPNSHAAHMTSAHLRLQQIKIIFQSASNKNCADLTNPNPNSVVNSTLQDFLMKQFITSVNHSDYFKGTVKPLAEVDKQPQALKRPNQPHSASRQAAADFDPVDFGSKRSHDAAAHFLNPRNESEAEEAFIPPNRPASHQVQAQPVFDHQLLSDIQSSKSSAAHYNPFSSTVLIFDNNANTSFLDARGRIVLNINSSTPGDYVTQSNLPNPDWMKLFNDPQLFVRINQLNSRLYQLKSLEHKVARAIGVADIFSEAALISSAAYIDWLNHLHHHSNQFSHLLKQIQPFNQLLIRVQDGSNGKSSDLTVEKVIGVILVSCNTAPAELAKFLLAHATLAASIQSSYRIRCESYNSLLLQTKRQLKLKALEQCTSISQAEMLSACAGLSQLWGEARNNLADLQIRIGKNYQSVDEAGFLTLSYKFTRDKL
jgi:hypothetical protein